MYKQKDKKQENVIVTLKGFPVGNISNLYVRTRNVAMFSHHSLFFAVCHFFKMEKHLCGGACQNFVFVSSSCLFDNAQHFATEKKEQIWQQCLISLNMTF